MIKVGMKVYAKEVVGRGNTTLNEVSEFYVIDIIGDKVSLIDCAYLNYYTYDKNKIYLNKEDVK